MWIRWAGQRNRSRYIGRGFIVAGAAGWHASVMVAEQHDDAPADDVEPSLLLLQHPAQASAAAACSCSSSSPASSPLLLLLLSHIVHPG
ncbi:hypothetical protein BRADI_2g17652v3 [Brachypodium distachyon]|uniref:Uncharacterized protein n=1 Tax=Brachypodium distachyon TaxID=15368 RepID=A0A0Q3G3F8_BRADI|nr:hypothetical protein BRADI_2g17652v3 [Brachypodium distachyon]